MKNGALIFLAAFVALGGSWCGFVLAPQLQLGGMKQTTILNSSDVYPVGRPGGANLGLQAYRANGCAACHTKHVRQDGVACDVILVDAGKNRTAVQATAQAVNPALPGLTGSRQTILHNASKADADAAVGKILAAGGKAEISIIAIGPDIARGWGLRGSVAEDYLYDHPVQPGSLRAGPDLADEGTRLPDINWQLVHLYAPRSLIEGSMMPPYRYLFEIRKIGRKPSPDALMLPPELMLVGREIVPKPEAKELAEYLLSLHVDVPLPDAPVTPPGGRRASSGGELSSSQAGPGEDAMFARGRAVYGSLCGLCHGNDGLGKPGQVPPLAGSEWVNAKGIQRLARISLAGLNGKIQVEGKDWNLSMAAMGAALSDADLAAVLIFIRQSWGNQGGAVTADEVQAVRATLGTRPQPLTGDQLKSVTE
ncbi:MAG TPA: cbb3-type cytochrome c oxidase subunit II [Candidatus Limnocylindrales bacterium]|nr:cbb3-type cytochrome c oxidase subunit II [Candidatus Limnocylindrales bacterium]